MHIFFCLLEKELQKSLYLIWNEILYIYIYDYMFRVLSYSHKYSRNPKDCHAPSDFSSTHQDAEQHQVRGSIMVLGPPFSILSSHSHTWLSMEEESWERISAFLMQLMNCIIKWTKIGYQMSHSTSQISSTTTGQSLKDVHTSPTFRCNFVCLIDWLPSWVTILEINLAVETVFNINICPISIQVHAWDGKKTFFCKCSQLSSLLSKQLDFKLPGKETPSTEVMLPVFFAFKTGCAVFESSEWSPTMLSKVIKL